MRSDGTYHRGELMWRAGDVVELVESTRAGSTLKPGMRGTVTRIDSNGVFWVDWSHGVLLPMIPDVDVIVEACDWGTD